MVSHPSGNRLLISIEKKSKLNISEEELARQKIHRIHENFSIIATATPPTITNPWLTHEILPLFHFHVIDRTAIGPDIQQTSLFKVIALDTMSPNR